MSIQIFKKNIPNEILFELLDSICLKNEKHYTFNTDSFKRGIYKEDHASIGISIYNIGKCYHDLGDAEQARIYYNKAYIIFTKSLGEEHPNNIRIKDKIAQLDDL